MTFTITHVGSIDDGFVNGLQSVVTSNSHRIDSLLLNISSLGGSVTAGIAAYNYLKSLPFKVHTHNLGEVSSAAILPYLAGNIRTTEPISKFVIHPVEISLTESAPFFKVQELLSSLSVDIDNYAMIVETEAPEIKKELDVSDLLKHNSFVISSDEALRFGLITR